MWLLIVCIYLLGAGAVGLELYMLKDVAQDQISFVSICAGAMMVALTIMTVIVTVAMAEITKELLRGFL